MVWYVSYVDFNIQVNFTVRAMVLGHCVESVYMFHFQQQTS